MPIYSMIRSARPRRRSAPMSRRAQNRRSSPRSLNRSPMSGQADDLPAEAAEALPLLEAFRANADPDLMTRYRGLTARVERENQWVRRRRGDPLLAQLRELEMRIEAAFIAKLRDGELTAWGREGSPIGSWREIPSSAWSTLQLDDPNMGTVKGPGVVLFDVSVGRRVSVPIPPLAETGAPGRPSSMYLVEAEFGLRCTAGELEEKLGPQARALAAWFKLNHPDKPAPTAKTIE